MGVSENSGTPKSSILIGFSIINHPFWGTTIFGNTHIGGMMVTCIWQWRFQQLMKNSGLQLPEASADQEKV